MPLPLALSRRRSRWGLALAGLLSCAEASAQHRPGPAYPLETIAAVRIDADRDSDPDRAGERVRVRGVLASTPGSLDRGKRVAYLVDDQAGIGLYGGDDQLAGARAGDLLEVVGEVGSFHGVEQIRIDRIRRLGRRGLPQPLAVPPAALLGERYAGRLVRVRGELRVSPEESMDRRFHLVRGETELPLYVPEPIHTAPGFPLGDDDAGREVEIVGFAAQYDRTPPYSTGYQLVPRSPEDVRVRGISRAAVGWGIVAAALAAVLAAAVVYYRRVGRIHREARRDELTGLLNRRGYEEAIRRVLDRARAQRTSVALLIVDLDNFKEANDRYGHLAGDAVLRQVGRILRQAVRDTDVVCRFAGDEFALIFPRLGGAHAVEVSNRIVHRLRTVQVETERGSCEVALGASAGLAVFDGSEPTGAEELFRAADAALYQAKQAGKGQTRFAMRAS